MADVSVKMGVSGITQFKQGMNDAAASVKTFDAALAANEKQLKATGNAEEYMQAKVQLLNGKLEAQQNAAKNAEAALRQMEQNGVKTTSAAYQNMQRKLIEAQTGILDTQQAIKGLGTQTTEAAGKVEKLEGGLKGLNQKVSLEQVRSAIGSITDGLEKAAKKAADVAEAVWGAMMDRAQWADDSATMAMMYGVDLDTFLRVQKLVQNGMDTSVEAILKSQSRLKKNVGSGSESFTQTMQELGLTAKDSTELFWEAGKALMSLGDEYEQENKAQILFGKSWRELIPLFTQFSSEAEFQEALAGVHVSTKEEVTTLGTLNDKIGELQGNFDDLETKLLAGLAPALTDAADALNGLLGSIMEYLETPEGKAALERMQEAFSGLFEGLANISAEDVVNGFASVFDKLIECLEWLKNNSGLVAGALSAIGIGFAGLKIGEVALDVMKFVNGMKDLLNLGGGGGGNGGTPKIQIPTGTNNPTTRVGTDLFDTGTKTALGAAATTALQKAGQTVAGLASAGAGMPLAAGYWAFQDQTETGRTLRDTGDVGAALNVAGEVIKNSAAEAGKYWLETIPEAFWGALGISKETMQQAAEYFVEANAAVESETEAPQQDYHTAPDKDTWTFGDDWSISDIQEYLNESGGVQVPATLDIEDTEQDLQGMADEEVTEPVEIPSIAELPADMQQQLQEHIDGWGPFKIYITPVIGEPQGSLVPGHANGLPYVPFDGYAAILHKGERVVPANQNGGSRSFSSNLYVESMYMNNGTDAEGLASAIAAANRRTMSGYGS